jgi:single-strand DNA-binding protein
MTDINHVVLIGRLTRDLGSDERSFGYVGNGQARANVSIAVNRSKKSGDQWVDEVNYFDVTIWGKTAENLKPYLVKGKQIVVDGHLKQERWEKEGQKMSRISIVADNVQLLGGNNGNSQNNANNNNSAGAYSQSVNAAPVQNETGFPEDVPWN